jgi:hypothetical protein
MNLQSPLSISHTAMVPTAAHQACNHATNTMIAIIRASALLLPFQFHHHSITMATPPLLPLCSIQFHNITNLQIHRPIKQSQSTCSQSTPASLRPVSHRSTLTTPPPSCCSPPVLTSLSLPAAGNHHRSSPSRCRRSFPAAHLNVHSTRPDASPARIPALPCIDFPSQAAGFSTIDEPSTEPVDPICRAAIQPS